MLRSEVEGDLWRLTWSGARMVAVDWRDGKNAVSCALDGESDPLYFLIFIID